YSQIVKSSRRSIQYALGGSSASSHGQRFRTGNRLVDQDLARMSVLCLRHGDDGRSEEHTSELQSRVDLVCRLLLEKKKIIHDMVHVESQLASHAIFHSIGYTVTLRYALIKSTQIV